MRYFLDTEFNQTVDPVQLISIGIVAEDGREFYAISSEFDPHVCDDWLKRNVLLLLASGLPWLPLSEIRQGIERFVAGDNQIQFWGYYAAYDWFLFTRLWGFLHMPEGFPMLCMDVKQYAAHLGVRHLPAPFEPQHHALVDARWTKRAFEYLQTGE